jgi:hypothetical protein
MAGKFESVASAMMTTTYRLDLPFGRLGRRGALDEDRDDSGCVDVNENAGRSAPVTCRLLERPVPHEACGAVQTWPASLEVFAAQPQLRIGLSLLPFRKVDLLSYSSAHFCEACVTAFWEIGQMSRRNSRQPSTDGVRFFSSLQFFLEFLALQHLIGLLSDFNLLRIRTIGTPP